MEDLVVQNDIGCFIIDGDTCYAGKHLLIDLYDCGYHGSIEEIETVMKQACVATGATILHSHLHPFNGGGVSGAIILAESHSTIHSWFDEKFIALDIFVCGKCDPYLAVPVFEQFFKPAMTKISLEKRGIATL